MKNALMLIIIFFIAMNTAWLAGLYLTGKTIEFNVFVNLVMPVICALASWNTERTNTQR